MPDTLSTTFILGYHGCDEAVAEKVLSGSAFKKSENKYDWLGSGIYFWEKNPERGFEFAKNLVASGRSSIKNPTVIGAVIDLGLCLDLTTKASIEQVAGAYHALVTVSGEAGGKLPDNNEDGLRRNLDCSVINFLHEIRASSGEEEIDTVKGIFIEGQPVYPSAGFFNKTHLQICVRNTACIKGVFRVKM